MRICVAILCICVSAAHAAPPLVMFGTRSSYPADGTNALAVGHFNDDSRADIAAVGLDPDGNPIVNILFGQADGTFRIQSPALTVAGAVLPFDGIAAGNLSRSDAFDDLALLVPSSDTFEDMLEVFANLGGSQQVTFQPPAAALPLGEGPIGIAVLDFNGDGLPDLAVPNTDDGTLSLFRKAGNLFAPALIVPTGIDPTAGLGAPVAVAAGRLDADAKPDLAVALHDDDALAIHINTQTTSDNPTFASPVIYTNGAEIGPTGVVIADFNRDGHNDVAMSSEGGTISIRLNQGNGTLGTPVFYQIKSQATVDGLAVADFNGDHNLDILTQNGDDTISILLGNGDGTMTADPTLASIDVGSGLAGIAIADFNGDGKLDVAVAEEDDGTVSVLLGGGINPPPTRTLTPTRTGTSTATPTITPTPSQTGTFTRTGTPTQTVPPTSTSIPTPATPTATRTPTRSPSPTITPQSAPAGDADCNGVVDDDDVATIEQRLFDPSVHPECNGADANRDGDVTAADLTRTLQLRRP